MCSILKDSRMLLLLEDMDIHDIFELHEKIRRYKDVEFEYKHLTGVLTISHVGHYPDILDIAAHVNLNGSDDSILGDDIVYKFSEIEPKRFKYF